MTEILIISLGISITPRAQMLGDGIVSDQPLPAGETEVSYKRTTKYGIAIVVSFGL